MVTLNLGLLCRRREDIRVSFSDLLDEYFARARVDTDMFFVSDASDIVRDCLLWILDLWIYGAMDLGLRIVLGGF